MIVRSLVLILVCAWAVPAAAQVRIVATGGDGLARRLAAELRARGYDVEPAESPRATVTAVVETTDLPPRIRLCTPDAQALVCETLEGDGSSVLVLQAIEVLRARLGEPGTAAPSPEPDPEPEPEPAPAVEPPACPVCPAPTPHRSVLEARIGPTVLLPASGIDTGAGAAIELEWAIDPWLALGLGGLVSLADPTAGTADASASFATRAAWLSIDLRVPEPVLGGHHLLLGLAASLAGADVSARAAEPLDERPTALTAFAPMARATFVAHLIDRLRLGVGARVGVALPQPVLLFGDVEVARWGAPLWTLEVTLGAAVD